MAGAQPACKLRHDIRIQIIKPNRYLKHFINEYHNELYKEVNQYVIIVDNLVGRIIL